MMTICSMPRNHSQRASGQADFYVVQTRTPGAKDQADIVFFIVDGKSPGIESKPWNALGVRANHSGPIQYTSVRVPQRDRLGAEGQGRKSSTTVSRPSI